MWCAHCREDVATEISEDGQALNCVSCGEQVRQVFAPSLHPETKSARDLLQRWAEEQKLELERLKSGTDSETTQSAEPASAQKVAQEETLASSDSDKVAETLANIIQDSEQAPADPEETHHVLPETTEHHPAASREVTQPEEAKPEEVLQNELAPKHKPKFRIDAPHQDFHSQSKATDSSSNPKAKSSTPPPEALVQSENLADQRMPSDASENVETETAAPTPGPVAADGHSVRYSMQHESHTDIPSPHFDVVAASRNAKSRPGRAETIWGQLMAYAGVGVLTVGTVLVLWGYFGMVENYASTGWLLSTAGQMLLLLGIVTLISGGMQQTTHEVTERIEYLGGRMIRIEESTDRILNGPHFHRTHQSEPSASAKRDSAET